MLGSAAKETSLNELSGGGLSGKAESSKLAGGSYEDNMNAGAAVAKKAKKEKKSGGGGGYSMAEVAKHTTKSDCWVVVSGQVLTSPSSLASILVESLRSLHSLA